MYWFLAVLWNANVLVTFALEVISFEFQGITLLLLVTTLAVVASPKTNWPHDPKQKCEGLTCSVSTEFGLHWLPSQASLIQQGISTYAKPILLNQFCSCKRTSTYAKRASFMHTSSIHTMMHRRFKILNLWYKQNCY